MLLIEYNREVARLIDTKFAPLGAKIWQLDINATDLNWYKMPFAYAHLDWCGPINIKKITTMFNVMAKLTQYSRLRITYSLNRYKAGEPALFELVKVLRKSYPLMPDTAMAYSKALVFDLLNAREAVDQMFNNLPELNLCLSKVTCCTYKEAGRASPMGSIWFDFNPEMPMSPTKARKELFALPVEFEL